MKEPRYFPTEVVYSMISGRCLCRGSQIQEAMEYTLGTPILTHHLAMPDLWDAVRAHLSQYFPTLAAYDLGEAPEADREEWAYQHTMNLIALVNDYTLPVVPMDPPWRTPGIYEGLPEGMETIFVPASGDPEEMAGKILSIIQRPGDEP